MEHRDNTNRRAILWNAQHPEARQAVKRRDHLKRSYGITSEQYDALLAKQGGRCALCGSGFFSLCLDHDHVTGKVRGLLCRVCNRRLGDLEDPAFIEAARRYLEEPPFTD
jgi:hypothetical protein